MKKGLICVLLLVVAFGLYACGGQSSGSGQKSDSEEQIAAGYRLKQVTVDGHIGQLYECTSNTSYRQAEIDEWANGQAVNDWYESGSDSRSNWYFYPCTWSFEYDSSGNLTRKAWVDENGEIGEYLYTYDDNGNELTSRTLINGAETKSVAKEYNDEGTKIKQTTSAFANYASGTARGDVVITYDEHGNTVSEEQVSNGDVTPVRTYENSYDSMGNIIEKREVRGSIIDSTTTWTRNDKGDPLTMVTDDGSSYKRTREWQYDDDGNLLLYKEARAGDYSITVEHVYENGLETGIIYTDDKTGRVFRTIEREHYPNGNVKTETDDNHSEAITSTTYIRDFDDIGNLTQVTARAPGKFGGELHIYFEYEQA